MSVNDTEATTLKVVLENAAQVNQPMTEKAAAKRMVTQAVYSTLAPSQLICQLVGGGVPERYPDLHFSLIEFNAHWLASLVGGMDKCWVTGIGQDADWWLGKWDDTRPMDDQPNMAQLFKLNEKWPYPLTPSEYVQRQFHVQFQDDPVAIACRHITGLSTLVWGNDYPHAEGTFRGSRELNAKQFAGVPDDERKAILGGTLGDLLGYQAPVAGLSLSELRFDGRVAVVTGAGRGIGRAYARLLAERGRQRRRQRPRRLDGRRRAPTRGPAAAVVGRDRRPPAARRSPTPATWPPTDGRRGARRRRGRAASAASTSLVNNAGIMRWAAVPRRRPRRPRPATSPCTSAGRSTPPGPPGPTSSSRATAAS